LLIDNKHACYRLSLIDTDLLYPLSVIYAIKEPFKPTNAVKPSTLQVI